MEYGILLIRADCVEVEVMLPISRITLMFRCSAKEMPVPENLIEVSRTQPGSFLHEPIRISPGALQDARKTAATAIANHRAAYALRSRSRLKSFQLTFQFQ